jgi:cell division septum initiation protein DivIVA
VALDYKHWILTHAIWIAAVAAGFVGFHSWLGEHDQRLKAEQQFKVSEQAIKGLQTQVDANNQQIATLQKSIEDVNAAAKKQVQVIVQQKEKVTTPAQALAGINSVSDRPLDAVSLPDMPDRASVLVLPLYQELADFQIAKINLAACTTNLATETKIADDNANNYKSQVAITGEKQKEIDALKKPKSFWKRTWGVVKTVGLSVVGGYVLGKKF